MLEELVAGPGSAQSLPTSRLGSNNRSWKPTLFSSHSVRSTFSLGHLLGHLLEGKISMGREWGVLIYLW